MSFPGELPDRILARQINRAQLNDCSVVLNIEEHSSKAYLTFLQQSSPEQLFVGRSGAHTLPTSFDHSCIEDSARLAPLFFSAS